MAQADVESIGIWRLTLRAPRVLLAADADAAQRGHDFIGAEHLLLGFVSDPDGIAGQANQATGATSTLRSLLEDVMEPDGYRGKTQPPAT